MRWRRMVVGSWGWKRQEARPGGEEKRNRRGYPGRPKVEVSTGRVGAVSPAR